MGVRDKQTMNNRTDGLTGRDWDEVRIWVRRLAEQPHDDELLTEFEAWVQEMPVRAEAIRKLENLERLIPLLRRDYLAGQGQPAKKQDS